jgi:hypothetical protein
MILTEEEKKIRDKKYQRTWYLKHREIELQKGREYKKRNKEKLLEQGREYAKAHREERREQAKEYRKKYPERRKAQWAAWYTKNKTKAAEVKKAYRKKYPHKEKAGQFRRKYSLTWDQYQEMVQKQSGYCCSCGLPTKKLFVDHDHETGKVRSLLCNGCNAALGHLKESPERVLALLKYIETHCNPLWIGK